MYYRYKDFKKWSCENIHIISSCFVLFTLFFILITELINTIFNIDIILEIFSSGFIINILILKLFFSSNEKKQIDEVINLYLSENGYKTEQLEDFLQDKSISFLTKFNLLLHVLMPLPIFFSTSHVNLKRNVNLFTFVFYLFCLLFSILIYISGVIA
jgi:hypothetical protein